MAEDLIPGTALPTATAPFLLNIEEEGLYLQRYAAVAVVGRIVRGEVSAGDSLDLIGFAPLARRIQMRAVAVVEGGLTFYLLDGIAKEEIHRGQVLATSGTIQPAKIFRAEVLFDERYERITQQPFQGVCRYLFHIWTTDVFGTLYLPEGKQHLTHGNRFTARIELNEFVALEVGLHFGIGRLLGQGTIIEVIG